MYRALNNISNRQPVESTAGGKKAILAETKKVLVLAAIITALVLTTFQVAFAHEPGRLALNIFAYKLYSKDKNHV